MGFFRGWALLVILFVGPSVSAAEIARWEAGKGGQQGGVVLVNAAGNKYTLTQQHKFEVAAIEPTRDYYRRAEFIAKVSKPVGYPVWLVLEYLDEGYGLISVGPAGRRGLRYIPWTHQWGVARLNTGGLRRATFRIDGPPAHSPAHPDSEGTLDFHINGVEYLHAIFLDDSEPAIEAVPEVKPAIQLDEAFQRDINIGADSPPGEEAEALAAILLRLAHRSFSPSGLIFG